MQEEYLCATCCLGHAGILVSKAERDFLVLENVCLRCRTLLGALEASLEGRQYCVDTEFTDYMILGVENTFALLFKAHSGLGG